MTTQTNYLSLIRELIKFSPRLGKNEQKTAKFIEKYLKENELPFVVEKFHTSYPKNIKTYLRVDGEEVGCKPTSFTDGKIKRKFQIVNSLIESGDGKNINFNPKSEDLSLAQHYFSPSIAIGKDDLAKVKTGTEIEGSIDVDRTSYLSKNILVGNKNNPQYLIFAHYDCLETGATDNASGVSVMMGVIRENRDLLKNCLFIFSGNEEISYDRPNYWGRGFRMFDKRHPKLFKEAKNILIVDCVGNDKTKISKNKELVMECFPIKNIGKLKDKIVVACASLKKLYEVYHSKGDTIEQLSETNLKQASKIVANFLGK
jgi:hypothetical protein